MKHIEMPPKAPVLHHICFQNGTLSGTLLHELRIQSEKSMELIQLGAVYLNSVRCKNPEQSVNQGDHVRVHSGPTRYDLSVFRPQVHVVFESEELVIVRKPAGLPCIPRVDNWNENLMALVREQIQHEVHVTHRLDIPTAGLIVLAKTKDAQSLFNKMLIQHRIEKYYLTTVIGQCEHRGLIEHWMKPTEISPKEVTSTAQENYLHCRLQIVDGQYDKNTNSSRLEIRLETGRTHQIRAQMTALGHPLLGDVQYGGPAWSGPGIALQAHRLKFNWRGNQYDFKDSTAHS